MKPLYEPKGKAREYGEYAVNIYTGCPHRCYYCFAPNVLHKDKEHFHSCVEPRPGIVEALRDQLRHEGIKDKLIHLCFSCDPYPTGCDSSVTREVIQVIKESGNHVQILTKGDGSRDFDLLDENDWYGITYSCSDGLAAKAEPNAISPCRRLATLQMAKDMGFHTWVSFEPIINADDVLGALIWLATTETVNFRKSVSVDKVMIGKLNYHPSDIDWKSFGEKAEALCQELGLDYYIKESLRGEMQK